MNEAEQDDSPTPAGWHPNQKHSTAATLMRAAVAGRDFPSDEVLDTPENRAMFQEMLAEILSKPGVNWDIPAEITDL